MGPLDFLVSRLNEMLTVNRPNTSDSDAFPSKSRYLFIYVGKIKLEQGAE